MGENKTLFLKQPGGEFQHVGLVLHVHRLGSLGGQVGIEHGNLWVVKEKKKSVGFLGKGEPVLFFFQNLVRAPVIAHGKGGVTPGGAWNQIPAKKQGS